MTRTRFQSVKETSRLNSKDSLSGFVMFSRNYDHFDTTVQDRRPGLQQLLTACETTWEEIMDKYGNRPCHG